VTSSNPIAAYAAVSAGIPLKKATKITGIAKAFSSQVGAGPFPTETEDSIFDSLRGTGQNIDDEFGARTGRPRRLGWLDIPVLKFANMINGFDELAICKLDKLDLLEEIKICSAYEYEGQIIKSFTTATILEKVKPVYETFQGWQTPTTNISDFEELPQNAKKYIYRIEELVGVPVKYIGIGPSRNDIICR
jgi:adenylosuccinate synthase